MAPLPVGSHPRWRPTAMLDQFKMVVYVHFLKLNSFRKGNDYQGRLNLGE